MKSIYKVTILAVIVVLLLATLQSNGQGVNADMGTKRIADSINAKAWSGWIITNEKLSNAQQVRFLDDGTIELIRVDSLTALKMMGKEIKRLQEKSNRLQKLCADILKEWKSQNNSMKRDLQIIPMKVYPLKP